MKLKWLNNSFNKLTINIYIYKNHTKKLIYIKTYLGNSWNRVKD